MIIGSYFNELIWRRSIDRSAFMFLYTSIQWNAMILILHLIFDCDSLTRSLLYFTSSISFAKATSSVHRDLLAAIPLQMFLLPSIPSAALKTHKLSALFQIKYVFDKHHPFCPQRSICRNTGQYTPRAINMIRSPPKPILPNPITKKII